MSKSKPLASTSRHVRRAVCGAFLVAIAAAVPAGVASARSLDRASHTTVHNVCWSSPALGHRYAVTVNGARGYTWDINSDGYQDLWALDTNGRGRITAVFADANYDGDVDVAAFCGQHWLTIAQLQRLVAQRRAQAARGRAASNQAWRQMEPTLDVLYGLNEIGPDIYDFAP